MESKPENFIEQIIKEDLASGFDPQKLKFRFTTLVDSSIIKLKPSKIFKSSFNNSMSNLPEGYSLDLFSYDYEYNVDEHDIIQQGFLHINHADMYLKNKVKNIFHLRASENELNTSFNQVKFLNADIDDLRGHYPKALDDWHPGIECQEQYASQIKKEIQKSI